MYDEGTVAACQYPMLPRQCTLVGGTTPSVPTVFNASGRVQYWGGTDVPVYSNIMKMPNAFVGEARQGCYMPLRLDTNHQNWHDENDVCYSAASYNQTLTQSALSGVFPYFDCTPAYIAANSSTLSGDQHLQAATQTAGVISLRGLNAQAKITLMIRSGFECQAAPDSVYAPFLRMSCPADEVAYSAYYAVSRQLKDAYPVEYNDFGKLWDVIKGVARTIDPFLGLVPGGNIVRGVGRAVGRAVDAYRSPDEPLKGPQDPPSQAELERAQERAHQVMRVPAKVYLKQSRKPVKIARRRS
jgi:hypothetical protein